MHLDCIFVFQVLFVSVVCDWLMCAATDLCMTYVLFTMLIVLMPAQYRTLCIMTGKKCDRVGDVYCVNCDNVIEVL